MYKARVYGHESYGAPERVTGRLTTTAGQPISGALIDMGETPATRAPRPCSRGGSHRTHGRWTLPCPGDLLGRAALRLPQPPERHGPRRPDALTLHVHAGITLHIAPHVTSVGRQNHFSGVLHGAPIPPGGKQLVLEASSGGEWIQFNTITTNAKGRYRASYRFKFPAP